MMIATWASATGKKLENKDFPIYFQTTKGMITFQTQDDLEQWFHEWEPIDSKDAYYDFCLISYWPIIFTPLIKDFLQRHYYLKQFNMYSFGQNFDEQPAVFIDGIDIIESCMTAVMKDKKNGN